MLPRAFALTLALACSSAALAQPAPFGFGGPSADAAFAIDALADGTFAVGGTTFGGYDPDPSGADATVPGGGSQDGFAAVYGPDGAFRFVVPIGPPGPSAVDDVYDVALGPDGSLVVVGQVGERVDLDPGPGTFVLEAPGLAVDVFVAAYGPGGAFRWGFAIPGLDFEQRAHVEVGTDGAVYLAASVSRPADLDPGPGKAIVDGFRSATLASYTADGDFRWGFALQGAQYRARGIAVTADRVALAGDLISGGVDVDPGPGEVIVDAPGVSSWLAASYTTDGSLVGAFAVGGSNFGGVADLALGLDGGVALVGTIDRDADFDPGAGELLVEHTGGSGGTGVVASYAADGTPRFAYGMGGVQPRGVALEGNRLVWTGHFADAFDPDPGAGDATLTPVAGFDMVTVGLRRSGRFEWAAPITGPGTGDNGLDVALAGGRTFASGRFSGTVDADPGAGEVVLSSRSGFDFDALVVAYTPTGDLAALPTRAETAPGSGAVALRVGPSPARGSASVWVRAPREVRVEVVDALGRVVTVLHAGRIAGERRLAVPRLAPGAYRVRAWSGGEVASVPLVIVR